MTQLIHNQIPGSLRPVVSDYRSGDLAYPRVRGGPRVLAPTWKNVKEWAPEYEIGRESFYKRYCSLTLRPDRPSAEVDNVVAPPEMVRGSYKRGFSIKFSPFHSHPGCVRMDCGVDVDTAVNSGLLKSGSAVVTPTMSGLFITRCETGSTIRPGRHPRFLGPPISYRMQTRSRPEFWPVEIPEDGVVLAKVPPERLLELFGVIVRA